MVRAFLPLENIRNESLYCGFTKPLSNALFLKGISRVSNKDDYRFTYGRVNCMSALPRRGQYRYHLKNDSFYNGYCTIVDGLYRGRYQD